MGNIDRRAALRAGYNQLLLEIPYWIDEGLKSRNPRVREVAQHITDHESAGLRQIAAIDPQNGADTGFIDALMCRYAGIQACLLSDTFIADANPDTALVMGEYLDKIDENLREFYDNDFSISAHTELTRKFYTAIFQTRADAVIGARLNCVGALINDAQDIMRNGTFPTPVPQYPSGLACRSWS